ncbi:MAG: hypothetical protein WDN03_08505 [Rhizomicrobium sp.]
MRVGASGVVGHCVIAKALYGQLSICFFQFNASNDRGAMIPKSISCLKEFEQMLGSPQMTGEYQLHNRLDRSFVVDPVGQELRPRERHDDQQRRIRVEVRCEFAHCDGVFDSAPAIFGTEGK